MEITDKLKLQKARISRGYLDQAKSFGIEQDLEFCPCLDVHTINAYNQSLMSGYNTPMMTNAAMRLHQQQQVQQQAVDYESVLKILAAAAANNPNSVNTTRSNMNSPYIKSHANVNTNGNGNANLNMNVSASQINIKDLKKYMDSTYR